MVRNSRQLTRFFFVLVLAMALFGGWYASQNWQIEVETFDSINLPSEENWADLVADVSEEAIQLFLGFTSDGQ